MLTFFNVCVTLLAMFLYAWLLFISLLIGQEAFVLEFLKLGVVAASLYYGAYLLGKHYTNWSKRTLKQLLVMIGLHLLLPVLTGLFAYILRLF